MSELYPSSSSDRDAWILAHRVNVPRAKLNSRRAAGWGKEVEPDPQGRLRAGLTIFLTNRECPWRCLMCDLWRQTLTERVRIGDVPFQLAGALNEAHFVSTGDPWIKLYNAGSFFDPGAIPPDDHFAISQQVGPFARVIVENHPSLTDRRILHFRERLGAVRLEIALGLETAHPEVLEKLNKRIDLAGFRRAADFLVANDVDLRVFVLIKPPFLTEADALEWACRSVDFAFDCGAKVVSLIPTRYGNGALEALARRGEFSPPQTETVDAVFRYGLSLRRGRVFVDLWNLEHAISNPADVPAFRDRWGLMNDAQNVSG